jgi:hypothetical protein
MRTIISNVSANAKRVEAEVRQIHATGKRIAGNRKLALRFLAATGMYTAKGNLKRRFR